MRQQHCQRCPCGRISIRRMSVVRGTRGVTLIELVTTLAIIAILGTFGLTTFADTLARQRVQTALHLISADLAMARNTAIMRRNQVVVCPGDAMLGCRSDADWSRGWIVFTDADGNRQPDADSDLIRVANAPSGAPASTRLASTRNFVRYQRDGRSAGTNLTINVCHKQMLAGQVVVNNLGRVRSARPTRQVACPF
jgi:type IV fimbrial biogenesis protein FimT